MQITLLQTDITTVAADAIVNAANTSLMGGGGVDGAIHRKGGPAILEDCMKIVARQGGCKTGEAVFTTAGNLPARYVIHTVGPVWNGGQKGEPERLKNCYLNALKIADELQLKTVAFPNISTGIYRYPKQAAASVAINTVREADTQVEEVIFVCFDEENYLIYKALLKIYD